MEGWRNRGRVGYRRKGGGIDGEMGRCAEMRGREKNT